MLAAVLKEVNVIKLEDDPLPGAQSDSGGGEIVSAALTSRA